MSELRIQTGPSPAAESRRYHHGDLKSALLREAETILEREGIRALTLRAAARAAGVSHAAPANHFGDLTGLLSELAAIGFNRFSAALVAAMDASKDDARGGADAAGRAYVTFARRHPGLFALMFRSERLDDTRPALREAIGAARRALGRSAGSVSDGRQSGARIAARAAAQWSLVHGFAVLLLDGRLEGIIESLPDGQDADHLLEAVLANTRFGD